MNGSGMIQILEFQILEINRIPHVLAKNPPRRAVAPAAIEQVPARPDQPGIDVNFQPGGGLAFGVHVLCG